MAQEAIGGAVKPLVDLLGDPLLKSVLGSEQTEGQLLADFVEKVGALIGCISEGISDGILFAVVRAA
jgi:hypothetical protein